MWLLAWLRRWLNEPIFKPSWEETIMAAIDDLRAKLAETNASLDNIQADIVALQAQVNTGGLTAAETAEVSSLVNQVADKAAAIAAIVP